MKVAWVCEYPAAAFPDRPNLQGAPLSHPVPWIVVQAPAIAAAGVELHVVTVSKHIAADDEFERDGVHFHFLKIPRLPRAAFAYQIDRRRIQQCLRRIQPALVQGFGTESSFGYSAVSSPFPAVLMIQGIVAKIAASRGGAVWRRPGVLVSLLIEWLTVRRASHVVCETQFAADFVHGYQPNAHAHVVRTPIRDLWFDVARRADAAHPEVLFVGWVVPAKGVDVLLAAIGRLAEALPNVTLHVVGAYDADYYRDVLQPIMTRFGITGRVHWHGAQPPSFVAERMATASVLALPTFMDTAPNVVAEARAARVPVVASAVGGVPELIDDGVDGRLVPPGDATALADALRGVLTDPAAAAAMSERGRLRAERDHRVHTQVPELMRVYEMALHGWSRV